MLPPTQNTTTTFVVNLLKTAHKRCIPAYNTARAKRLAEQCMVKGRNSYKNYVKASLENSSVVVPDINLDIMRSFHNPKEFISEPLIKDKYFLSAIRYFKLAQNLGEKVIGKKVVAKAIAEDAKNKLAKLLSDEVSTATSSAGTTWGAAARHNLHSL